MLFRSIERLKIRRLKISNQCPSLDLSFLPDFLRAKNQSKRGAHISNGHKGVYRRILRSLSLGVGREGRGWKRTRTGERRSRCKRKGLEEDGSRIVHPRAVCQVSHSLSMRVGWLREHWQGNRLQLSEHAWLNVGVANADTSNHHHGSDLNLLSFPLNCISSIFIRVSF